MATLSTTPTAPPAPRSNGHDALEAVERLALATERAASARIERAIHAATTAARGVVRSVVMMAAAAAVVALGWVTLMIGTVLMLAPLIGGGLAALAVGLAQVIVGAGIAYAASRTGGDDDAEKPSERALS